MRSLLPFKTEFGDRLCGDDRVAHEAMQVCSGGLQTEDEITAAAKSPESHSF